MAWDKVPFCLQAAAGAQGEALDGGQAPFPGTWLLLGRAPHSWASEGCRAWGDGAAVCRALAPPNPPFHAAGSCRIAPCLPPWHGCHARCPQLGTQAPATPQQPTDASQLSLRPSLQSHGLQMGFYCILFCNGGGDMPIMGLQQVLSPRSRQDGAEPGQEGRLQLCWLSALAMDR